MITSQITVILFYAASLMYAAGLGCYLFRSHKALEFFLIFGVLLHLGSQLARGCYLGIFTPNAIFGEVFFLPFVLAMLTALLGLNKKDTPGLRSGIFLVVVFSLVGVFSPKGVMPPSPKSGTVFSTLFFLTEVVAHACFILGGWFALRYLVFKEGQTYFHNLLVWGFVSYSFAQIVGAIWAYLGWASPLSWSPRHLQSASIWCLYAAYLHLRFLPDWKPKNKAWFALAGTVLVLWFGYSGFLWELTMKIGV